MKFSIALAALAGIAAAAPQGTKLHQRTPSERTPRRSRPNQRLSQPVHAKLADGVRAQYSTNWAGVVKHGKGITKVAGTITVPSASGGSTDQAGAAWVGIDGDSCQGALLQTGIDFYGDGSYDAWYEWIPNNVVFFNNFPLSTGDKISMLVDATSKTTGVATLENLTTGQKISHTFTRTPSTLCETDAEWIVEDFQGDLAGFSEIVFTDNSAVGSQGTITPAGGDILDIRPDGGSVETDCGLNGNDVYCKYIGNN